MGEGIMLHRVKQRIPKFAFTGSSGLIDDGDGNWRIKLKSSGTLTFTSLANARKGIDVFLVGGGGGGSFINYYSLQRHGGGGAGYTRTVRNISVTKGTEYPVVIGAGANSGGTKAAAGGQSSVFGYKAAGGNGGTAGGYTAPDGTQSANAPGGNGGSGGATGRVYNPTGTGGVDGYNGSDSGSNSGKGQRYVSGPNGESGTTREFGEASGDLYAQGGGSNTANVANTGNGGYSTSINGSSGIVIIRNHRE